MELAPGFVAEDEAVVDPCLVERMALLALTATVFANFDNGRA